MTSSIMTLQWSSLEIGRAPGSNKIDGLDEVVGVRDGRLVYVIETPKKLSIRYESGISNICYIGRQSDRTSGHRLHGHAKGWISKFLLLSQSDEPFTLHYCHPRRRNRSDSFKDIEALLLREFDDKFGQLPLFNKRRERELADHEVDLNTSIFNRRRSTTKCPIDARRPISSEVQEDGS